MFKVRQMKLKNTCLKFMVREIAITAPIIVCWHAPYPLVQVAMVVAAFDTLDPTVWVSPICLCLGCAMLRRAFCDQFLTLFHVRPLWMATSSVTL
jgi:hypothetical protein